jgi:hypothetical protein
MSYDFKTSCSEWIASTLKGIGRAASQVQTVALPLSAVERLYDFIAILNEDLEFIRNSLREQYEVNEKLRSEVTRLRAGPDLPRAHDPDPIYLGTKTHWQRPGAMVVTDTACGRVLPATFHRKMKPIEEVTCKTCLARYQEFNGTEPPRPQEKADA